VFSALSAIGLVLVGCSEVDLGVPPVSRPVGQVPTGVTTLDETEVVLEDGRKPLHPSAWTAAELGWPPLEALEPAQADALVGVLNTLTAPCSPCWEEGMSYGTCLRARPPACLDLLAGLLDRGVRQAAAGADTEALRESLIFDDAWVPLPWDRVLATAPGWGSDDAPLRLVMVVDYQSPFSARAAETWGSVLAAHDGQVAVRVLHWTEARHPRSGPAAEAAEAAGRLGAFAPFHRLLLSRFQHLAEADLAVAAAEVGLDPAAFSEARADPELAQRVAAQQELARDLGTRSAPTLFVNGHRLRGARPQAQVEALLQRALPGEVDRP